jgi:hypothetical protein
VTDYFVRLGLAHGIQSWWQEYEKLLVAIVQRDRLAEEQARSLLQSSREGEFNLLVTDADLAFSQGKLRRDHALLDEMKTVAGKLNLQETAADTVASVALFGASVEAFRRRLGMHKPQSLCGARSHCYASGSGSLLFPGSLRRHNNWQRPSSSKGVTMSKYNRPLLRWCRRATFINQGDPTGFRTRSSPELGLRTEERHRGFMFAIGEEAKLVHLTFIVIRSH